MYKDPVQSYRYLLLKGLFENTSVQRNGLFSVLPADQSTDIKHSPGAQLSFNNT